MSRCTFLVAHRTVFNVFHQNSKFCLFVVGAMRLCARQRRYAIQQAKFVFSLSINPLELLIIATKNMAFIVYEITIAPRFRVFIVAAMLRTLFRGYSRIVCYKPGVAIIVLCSHKEAKSQTMTRLVYGVSTLKSINKRHQTKNCNAIADISTTRSIRQLVSFV